MFDWSSLKILLCDPDAHYRQLTQRMLRDKSPKAITEAEIGTGDAEMLARLKPSLIIGGVSEGDEATFELVHWLRDPNTTPCPGVPFILLAAVLSEETILRGIKAGVDHFVAKPTSPRILQRHVETLLTKPVLQARTPTYVGPDRRRLPSQAYDGPERRGAA